MKITDIKLYTVKSGDTRGLHGSSVYNYHLVMANTNSPYAEHLSVGKGTDIQPILVVIEGEPLPVNGKILLDPNKPGFGVALKRELPAPFKS
jgi:hypothetical protein